MKKVLSFVLALTMLATLSVPVLAVGADATNDSIEAKIAAEIQREEEQVFGNIYEQLKAQDALDFMDIYKEILSPRIEAAVYARYGVDSELARASTTYVFNNGGTMGYNSISDAVVLDTFYTADQYRAYLKDHTDVMEGIKGFSISSLLSYLKNKFGFLKDYAAEISKWGKIYDVLVLLVSLNNAMAQQSVNNADGFAEIINISTTGGVETVSTVIGWSNHPYVSVPPAASDVHVQWHS